MSIDTDTQAHPQQRAPADWLTELRQSAARAAEALQPPHPRSELWRLSDPKAFVAETYDGRPAAEAAPNQPDAEQVAELLALDGDVQPAARMVHSDGELRSLALHPEAQQAGVVFCSLERAARHYPGLLGSRLGTLVGFDEFYSAQSLARATGGTFLYVPKGVTLELPLQALSWLSPRAAAVHQRSVLVLEQGSSAVFVDVHASDELAEPALFSPVVEAFLRPSASLRWLTVQRLGAGVRHHGQLRAHLEQDAKLVTAQLALGGAHSRTSTRVSLGGSGAEADLLGGTFGLGGQTLEHWTVQDHQAPNTRSDLHYRGALAGKSRSVYTGTIIVAQGASGTDAYQKNRNLLLSPGARADTNPQLEIGTNEVRCTHGATVGPLQEEHLFYLMSRGLSRAEARRLLVHGFFNELVQQVSWAGMEQNLERQIDARLDAAITPEEHAG